MEVGRHDIVIGQGATFGPQFVWRDSSGTLVNLTGYSAAMQVRRRVEDPTFLLECTTVNGRISLGGPAGTIMFNVPAAVTGLLPTVPNAVWDLELTSPSGAVRTLLAGGCQITRQVTR